MECVRYRSIVVEGPTQKEGEMVRNPLLTTIVLAFALLAFFVGSVHEPWADEAQAALIARDATLPNLLFQLPHAEMNPSLWHLMLILPSTYLSYETLRYIALFFGSSELHWKPCS